MLYKKILIFLILILISLLVFFGKYEEQPIFMQIIRKINDSSVKSSTCSEQRLPDAIIIGAAKAGTGALMTFLRLNPRIVTPETEMHFFNRKYSQGLEIYRRSLPYARKNQIVVEKTPAYFRATGVPYKIYHMNRKIKLILTVKNPVNVAISFFTHFQLIKHYPENISIESIILNRKGQINKHAEPIRNARYAKNLLRYLKYFSLNQIHIVDGENLIQRPATELNKIEEFLGLEPQISGENFYFNPKKKFWCMIYQNERKCLGDHKGLKYVPVLESTRKKLKKFFEPLNEEFFQIINRRFDWS